MQTEFRSTTGASAIGVTAGFVYSGANNVQDVLLDLDRAVQRRQAGIDAAIVTSGATQTALTTHTDATTGVHGVSGDIVGTTDAQSLSNKTLNSPTINSPTINTPTIVGGTLSGTTAGGYEIGDKLNNLEGRLTAIEGEDNPAPINSWGSVNIPGVEDPTFFGYNIESIENIGMDLFRVHFNSALANTNYIVTATVRSDLNSLGPISIRNKTINGFDVYLKSTLASRAFDFSVIGPE